MASRHTRPTVGGNKLFAAAITAVSAGLLVHGAPAQGASGGVRWVQKPVISKVKCLRACASSKRMRGGSTIRVSGRNMAGATKVVFHGGRGRRDDRAAKPRRRTTRSVLVTVPLNAPSGPVSVWAGDDNRSKRTKALAVLPPPPPEYSPELTPVSGLRDPGGPRLETGTSQARFFFGSERQVRFSYRVSSDGPASVQVDLVRAADGAVVRSWPSQATPGAVQTVTWDGRDGAGQIQPQGRFSFRIVASGANGARAQSSQTQDVTRDAFDFYRHIFPVRGRHDYGHSGARFGSGRAGHSHQGHDVFARCGTRLVAARGGVVKFKQYHSAAGHYLVIDGDETDVDYAYMHLVSASPFAVGDRVYTGQKIGEVGDSGNARGCHLHFEMWGAPGWYDGGRPFDPYDHLKEWDSYS